ncbi:MAG: hypothetical protein GY731_05830 [Gammaproteobacteria bacterium]|nr:hypothetical protein [Gammaproteobacteria bacterium]
MLANIPEIADLRDQTGEGIVVELQAFPQRMRVNLKRLFIMPSRESLVIEPNISEEEIFPIISSLGTNIVNILPHTPIIAIGHNFSFNLDSDEEFNLDYSENNKIIADAVSASLDSVPGNISNLAKTSFAPEGKRYQLNITTESNPEKRKLLLNFHHDVKKTSIEDIQRIIESFPDNYRLSEQIKDALIGLG